jgi:hypothetical protein
MPRFAPTAEGTATWLTTLLDHGESVQQAAPDPATFVAPPVRAVLRDAFARHALAVAGPSLAFNEGLAVRAAAVVAVACWRLVADADDRPPLPPLGSPTSAAAHLSADLVLRLLPGVARRAKARGDVDLAGEVEAVLCRWPLSGVLADLEHPPAVPLDFFAHPGLLLLYAERLPAAPRSLWVPLGAARGWAERVFAARGRPLPDPPEAAA